MTAIVSATAPNATQEHRDNNQPFKHRHLGRLTKSLRQTLGPHTWLVNAQTNLVFGYKTAEHIDMRNTAIEFLSEEQQRQIEDIAQGWRRQMIINDIRDEEPRPSSCSREEFTQRLISRWERITPEMTQRSPQLEENRQMFTEALSGNPVALVRRQLYIELRRQHDLKEEAEGCSSMVIQRCKELYEKFLSCYPDLEKRITSINCTVVYTTQDQPGTPITKVFKYHLERRCGDRSCRSYETTRHRLKKCCTKAYYCNKQHQRNDRSHHKSNCLSVKKKLTHSSR